MSKKINIFISAIIIAISFVGEAKTLFTYSGVVHKIYDGDTIVVQDEKGEKHRIRFYAIDAPELHQEGGKESLQNLEQHLKKTDKIRIEVQNIDLYGREVALVYSGTVNLNQQQLADGYAWHYKQYDKLFQEEFDILEQETKEKKIGIWQNSNAIAPWEYRRRKRKNIF